MNDTFNKPYENISTLDLATQIHMRQSYILVNLYDMAYIASTADNSFVLARPFKSMRFVKNPQEYKQRLEDDIEFTSKHLSKNKELEKKLDKHKCMRNEFFKQVRQVYPEFCMDMEHKIPEKDYILYRKNKQLLKRAILKTNKYSDKFSAKDSLLEFQDGISKVIDTHEFSEACKIEDEFVLSELAVFFDRYSKLDKEKKDAFSRLTISHGNSTPVNILRLANKIKTERESRLDRYSSIDELYKKIENNDSCIIIKAPSSTKDDTER